MAYVKPDWEGFGRAMVEFEWPAMRDIEASELFDLAVEFNLVRPIEGGYDPEEHIDAEGIAPEKGDPWYEYNFGKTAQKEEME
jgi:hypothetical protein